ncbi:hypothetical protein IQ255_29490 [Pleurocapsales cyanobacterium LEGE 10410]|nr:hypothetical protein [Pleurocapsales cyanobacterium LEGE 10410]
MVESFYSPEILTFIDADSEFYQPITPDKFAVAGEYFADLAQVLNYSSDRWLRNWLNESYGKNEYCEVSHDWSDWLGSRTQQSVSVTFLSKYLPQPNSSNNYPDNRKTPSKIESVDNPKGYDLDRAINLATPEDISIWSKAVLDLVQPSKIPISFAKLITLSHLESVEIYLGIFLSDRFVIIKDDRNEFYSDFAVACR